MCSSLILFALLLVGCPAPQTLGDEDCVDCDNTETITCYPDNDGDGYGNLNFPEEYEAEACPEGTADNGSDWCDDNDQAWKFDDCHPVGVTDNDGDGYDESDGDCNDTDADIYPGADEYCDGVDNDCDGVVDESSALDTDTWYYDGDDDGYGDPDTMSESCYEPFAHAVQTDGDCDDTDASVHPGATEVHNDVDDDCDGDIDEGTQPELSVWWLEVDGDTLSIVDTVFEDSLDTDGVRVVGYGFGGTNDWSYTDGHDAGYDDGWFSYEFADGIYRITFRDSDEWALYEGYCVSTTEASPLCWDNQRSSGYSLCLGVEAGQIYDPADDVCDDTDI